MSEDTTKISEIDKLIAAAKARKAAKAALKGEDSTEETTSVAEPADKEAAKAARVAAREEKKAQIAKDREERKAAKAAGKSDKPAHMLKVNKAAERLPALDDSAQLILSDATSNLSAAQVAALALHLQHFNRVKATERALSSKIEAGTRVNIVGGDPRFIGLMGTVDKAQRIRCYVTVEGHAKPLYLFTSDVALVAVEEAPAATGTEG